MTCAKLLLRIRCCDDERRRFRAWPISDDALLFAPRSYFVSAKNGDQVSSSFYRVAADLAGVVLTKPELEVASQVVKAELINHQKDDPDAPEPKAKAGGPCSIM